MCLSFSPASALHRQFILLSRCSQLRFLRNSRLRDVLLVIELVELWLREAFTTEHVCAEPPREVLAGLVFHVRARRHSKHVVEFFEGALFGLGQPEEATIVSIWSQEGSMHSYIMKKASKFIAA
jgi:hypothetical protein